MHPYRLRRSRIGRVRIVQDQSKTSGSFRNIRPSQCWGTIFPVTCMNRRNLLTMCKGGRSKLESHRIAQREVTASVHISQRIRKAFRMPVLCAFAPAKNFRRIRGQIKHILWKEAGQISNDIAHRHHPYRSPSESISGRRCKPSTTILFSAYATPASTGSVTGSGVM